jgi:hypothetical protein
MYWDGQCFIPCAVDLAWIGLSRWKSVIPRTFQLEFLGMYAKCLWWFPQQFWHNDHKNLDTTFPGMFIYVSSSLIHNWSHDGSVSIAVGWRVRLRFLAVQDFLFPTVPRPTLNRLTIFFWVQPRTYFWNYLKVLTVYWNIKLYLFSCIFSARHDFFQKWFLF